MRRVRRERRAPRTDQGVTALAVTIVVGVPVGVGLWAWRERQDARFGHSLVAAGCVFFVATLAQSDNEVVYSIGRVEIWLTAAALPALLLADERGAAAGFELGRRPHILFDRDQHEGPGSAGTAIIPIG